MERVNYLLAALGIAAGSQIILQGIVAVGFFVAILGIVAAFRPSTSVQIRRIQAVASPLLGRNIVRPWDNDPTDLLRLFVPHSGTERSKISKSLRQAGIHKVKALRNFFLVRSVLALALPGCFVLAVCAATGPFTGLGSAEPN
jgi:tight adherence protein C